MHTVDELLSCLRRLAQVRPIFHSEADFQHAFAWHIRTADPQAEVRLEVPFRSTTRRTEYLDLLFVTGQTRIAVELKYKTRRLSHSHAQEVFELQMHGAQDLARYDYLLDVERLERFVSDQRAEHGFAVLLTNEPSYWSPAKRPGTIDEAFRLLEGRSLSGSMAWLAHASAGTTKGRTDPISLRGTYAANWHGYSRLGPSIGGEFRVLALQVQ